jgi:hypothetical protein
MGFKDYLGAFDEYIGDDELLGARAVVKHRAPPIRAVAQRQLMTPMPGVPKAGPRLEPVGFPAFAFVNAGATSIAQTTRPQKPFKGSRLVIDIARTGASAAGLLITVVSLKVGARDVLVNANPIGAGTFAPGAFGIELMMDEATPGIDIVLTLATSAAPGAGDRVDVAATIIGMTWS